MLFKPVAHYECFQCLRILGFGYDRTARHFRIKKITVYAWFKYRNLNIQRPKTKYITSRVIKPAKKYVKLTQKDWEIRFEKSHIKRKITCYLRAKVWQCFKLNLHTPSVEKLIGCSRIEFIGLMKSKFRDGMTIENYGKFWHLDHIKPCCKFDLSIRQQQLECFHFSNYQPLLASENCRKNRKYTLS